MYSIKLNYYVKDWNVFRIHSLHGENAISVLLKQSINGNEKGHTTDKSMSGILFCTY